MAIGTSRTAVLALLTCAGVCAGQTQQWADWLGNGDPWTDTASWSCQTGGGCVPNNNGTYSWLVLVRNGGLCDLNTSVTIDKLDVESGSILEQANNTTFTIVGDTDEDGSHGTFGIKGSVFRMGSIGWNTNLVVTGGAGATLRIGGETNDEGMIELSNTTLNRMYGASGQETIIFTRDLELWGSGQIGANSAGVVNDQCVLRATQSEPLILDPAPGLEWENNSFVIAEFNGTVQINQGTFNNVNGWVGANTPDARLLLNGGTIVGGHVQSGSGLMQFNGGSVVGTTCLLGHISTGEGGGLVTGATYVEDIVNYGTLVIANNSGGFHVQTEIRNYGLVSLESNGWNTDLILDNDVVLIQGGEVAMSSFAQNRIYGATGAEQLRNWDNWIHGSGQIGVNLTRLYNTGTIEADSPGGLLIDLAGDSSINQGVLAASNGATLTISSDTIDQTSTGMVFADDASVVQLTGVTLIDGSCDTAGTGVVRSSSARLIDPDNRGTFEQPNNSLSYLRGQVANPGSFNLLSIGWNTDIVLENDVTLSGGGAFNMSDREQNRIYSNGNSRLTNLDNTLRGGGQIGLNSTSLDNRGTIDADTPGVTLTVDPNTDGMTNTGTMRATGGGVLVLANADYDSTGGQVVAESGSVVRLGGGARVTGGIIGANAGGSLEFAGGSTLTTAPTIAAGASGAVTAGGGGAEAGLVNHGVATIGNNTNFRVAQNLHNTGLFGLESDGWNTDLVLAGDLLLDGGGEVRLTNRVQNRVYGATGAQRLTNADNRIHGGGQIGLNLLAFDNAGVIEADTASGLTIDLNDTSTNTGVMRASGGATLEIRSSPLIDQTGGGVIEVLDASTVTIRSSTVRSGTLATAGSGVVRAESGASLDSVSNTGMLELPNNNLVYLLNGLANSGVLSVTSIGWNTDLVASGDVTLTGGGEIVTSDRAENRLYAQANGDVITNEDNTLRIAGRLGLNIAAIVNRGTIVADRPNNGLDIDPSDAGGFLNEGLLRAQSVGGIEIFNGPFENRGDVEIDPGSFLFRRTTAYLQTGGTTMVNGPLTLNGGGVVSIEGGELSGNDTVGASVSNTGGTVAPGGAPGVLTVAGDYTQGAPAALEVSVGGGASRDVLAVGGVATLAGTLRVTTHGGYTPVEGHSFEILTAGAVAGGFDEIETPGFPNGLMVEPVYEATRVLAVVVAGGCVGDWNDDGTTNTLDFIAFLNDWSAGDPEADINGDGSVNTLDFIAFLNAWSAGCP